MLYMAAAAEEIKRLEQALSQAQHEQNRYESELHRVRQEKNLMELEAAEKTDEVEDMTMKLERVQTANAALQQRTQQARLHALLAHCGCHRTTNAHPGHGCKSRHHTQQIEFWFAVMMWVTASFKQRYI